MAAKRLVSCSHFIEHYSQTEQVPASIQLFSANLFWRHLVGGAHHGSSQSHALLGSCGQSGGRRGLEARQGTIVPTEFCTLEFDGHAEAKPQVFGLVNNAHAATI